MKLRKVLLLKGEQRKELFFTFYMQIFNVLIHTAATTIPSLVFYYVFLNKQFAGNSNSLLTIRSKYITYFLNLTFFKETISYANYQRTVTVNREKSLYRKFSITTCHATYQKAHRCNMPCITEMYLKTELNKHFMFISVSKECLKQW